MEPVDLFSIIGPVMTGPSSSHTAGALRLGLLARMLAGFQPVSATVMLHGSFGETGRGHGTDLGLAAGLMGWEPDDSRLPQVPEYLARAGMSVEFSRADLGRVHPNTARMELVGPAGDMVVVQGSSLGGGAVLVNHFNGWDVELNGLHDGLLLAHHDRPGVLAAVTGELAAAGLNIAAMRVSRRSRGGEALTAIDLDQVPTETVMRALNLRSEIRWVRRLDRLKTGGESA